MKSSQNVEHKGSIAYILYKKDNSEILVNIIVDKLQDSFKLMLKPILIDNRQVSIDNLYITGDRVFWLYYWVKNFSSKIMF